MLHGCAEPLPEDYLNKLINNISKTAEHTKKCFKGNLGNWDNWKNMLWQLKKTLDTSGITGGVKVLALGAIGIKYPSVIKAASLAARLYTYEKDDAPSASGSSSQAAIRKVEKGESIDFVSPWNPAEQCSNDIKECNLLGPNSIKILHAISSIVNNINKYEEERGCSYFRTENDVSRILAILNCAIMRICDLNLKATLSKQICDDKELLPTLEVLNSLIALPTKCHDIEAKQIENIAEIDRILSRFCQERQDGFFDYIAVLSARAKNILYGHDEKDAATHLFLAGPTCSGKSFFVEHILPLLGFSVIKMTVKEWLQATSTESVEKLLRSGNLSPLEKKLLCFAPGKANESCSLIPIIMFDEMDKDCGYSESRLKEKLCQFRRLYFPALGIEVPCFLHCIFTSNNPDLFKNDPALQSRVVQMDFPEYSLPEQKDIILSKLEQKFYQSPYLYGQFSIEHLAEIVNNYVEFDPESNLRDRLANLDYIPSFFETQIRVQNGEKHLVPPSRRNGPQRTFQEFLASIFNKKECAKTTRSKTTYTKKKKASGKSASLHHSSSDSKHSNNKFNQNHLPDDCYTDSSSDYSSCHSEQPTDDEPSSSCSEDSFNDYDTN